LLAPPSNSIEILLPMSLAPDWLQTVVGFNPFEHLVEAARAVFNGQWGNPEILIGAGLMAALAVIAVWVGSRAFSRAVAYLRSRRLVAGPVALGRRAGVSIRRPIDGPTIRP
jgi:ABC-type multidrug transport system permease subunit